MGRAPFLTLDTAVTGSHAQGTVFYQWTKQSPHAQGICLHEVNIHRVIKAMDRNKEGQRRKRRRVGQAVFSGTKVSLRSWHLSRDLKKEQNYSNHGD